MINPLAWLKSFLPGSRSPVLAAAVTSQEIQMFDLASFEAKMKAVMAALPAMGQMVQVAETLAPNAAGLTKAGLVINTIVAVEPTLVGLEQVLSAAITGVVAAYKSAGTLPASMPTPAATATTT